MFSKKTTSKLRVTILLLIVAVLLGVLLVLGLGKKIFKNSSEKYDSEEASADLPDSYLSNESWKEYTDEANGYKFLYPPDASVQEDVTVNNMTLSKTRESKGLNVQNEYKEPLSKWYVMTVAVSENPEKLDEITIINKYTDYLNSANFPKGAEIAEKIQNTINQTKLGEIDGYSFHIGYPTDAIMVVDARGSKLYTFRMSSDKGNINEFSNKVFNQILPTVQFTK
jgi:hypothetical protein